MPSKPCVILNPNAGSAPQVAAMLQRLSRLDDVVVRLTQRDGHAREIARRAADEGFDFIIAAGGDGTVNQVVNGLAPDFERALLGVIPLGTGNDLARSLDLPEDPALAVDALLEGRTRRIDLIRAEPSQIPYFVNHCTGGFSAMAGKNAEAEAKSNWGPLAYLTSAVSALAQAQEYHARVVLDERETLELDLYNVVLSNGRFVAGGIPIAPEARMDDGRMDVLLVPVESFPRLAVLVSQIMLGRHLEQPEVVYRRAARVRIAHPPGMAFTLDGESLERGPETFEVVPGALRAAVGVPPGEAPPAGGGAAEGETAGGVTAERRPAG